MPNWCPSLLFYLHSELLSWVNDTKALVSADELAKDVAGAEAIIQRHKERKGEIDAQEDSFKASAQFGQSLISAGHYESDQVKEIVSTYRSSINVSNTLTFL